MKLDNLWDEIDSLIEEAMFEALSLWKNRLEEKTPEDKRDLVKWYDIQPLEKDWDIIKGTILNNVPHWIYVEFWLSKEEWIPTWWKKFNYHKPKWVVFYRWVWARMVTKTYDENQDEIFQVFINKINKKVWQ